MYYTEIPNASCAKYLYFLSLTFPFDKYSTNTALPSMTQENIGGFDYAVPSDFQEQQKIAQFLDHETAKIDTLIDKQQQLIALLKEKRQAVISHAVSKGLDPTVEMRDSGVEWLGDVPVGWGQMKLKLQSTKIGDGLHATPDYQEGTELYFANGNNLRQGHVSIRENTKEVTVADYEKFRLELLDGLTLLVSLNGTVGNTAIYRGERVVLGKSAGYINCMSELQAEFLMYYFNSSQVQKYIDLEVTGTTIFNLSLNSIRNLTVCMPNADGMALVVEACRASLEKHSVLIGAAKKASELLKEKKSALISAAVTGKIDVRDWQPSSSGAEIEQSA